MSPWWSCDHASKQPSLFLLVILECGCLFSFRIFIYFWTSCGFQFCCKTSVLTMSSQDKKLRGKAQRKSAFVDIFSRIDDHHLQHGGRDVRRWMETFFCSECMFFFKDLVLLQIGTSSFYFFYGFST